MDKETCSEPIGDLPQRGLRLLPIDRAADHERERAQPRVGAFRVEPDLRAGDLGGQALIGNVEGGARSSDLLGLRIRG
jgi:hypothetical protein